MKDYKTLKRIYYYTLNSWNKSKSLAYNMKIYNLTENKEILENLYELLENKKGYLLRQKINNLISKFDFENNYEWQAGFNGASGGYLVLYSGGERDDGAIFVYSGKGHTEEDVPGYVKKAFRELALNIQRLAIETAKKMIGVKND